MEAETFTPKKHPDATFRIVPANGPCLWELEGSLIPGTLVPSGDAVYRCLRLCIRDWTNAPLLAGVSETYDPDLVDYLETTVADELVGRIMRLSRMSEDERKNSSSGSASSD